MNISRLFKMNINISCAWGGGKYTENKPYSFFWSKNEYKTQFYFRENVIKSNRTLHAHYLKLFGYCRYRSIYLHVFPRAEKYLSKKKSEISTIKKCSRYQPSVFGINSIAGPLFLPNYIHYHLKLVPSYDYSHGVGRCCPDRRQGTTHCCQKRPIGKCITVTQTRTWWEKNSEQKTQQSKTTK